MDARYRIPDKTRMDEEIFNVTGYIQNPESSIKDLISGIKK
jgi:hypothetical protein